MFENFESGFAMIEKLKLFVSKFWWIVVVLCAVAFVFRVLGFIEWPWLWVAAPICVGWWVRWLWSWRG